MKHFHTLATRWLLLTFTSLLFIGCGGSDNQGFSQLDFTVPEPGQPEATSREVVLLFDYNDVLARVPSSVGAYRIEVYSISGQQLSRQTITDRVSRTTLTDVTSEAFVLRIIGLDTNDNEIGYHDFSVPSGVGSVVLELDVLLVGQPPFPTFHTPDGVPAQLAFLLHPNDVMVDESFAVAVVALDAAGYRASEPSGSVSLGLSGSGTLGGTTAQAFTNGVARFQGLSVDSPGPENFLTASVAGLNAARSLNFSVEEVTPAEPVLQVPLAPGATTDQESPKVIADSNGNFVAVWADVATESVVGRRLTPDGQPIGSIFTVATDASFAYDMAPLPSGGFVVVWNVASNDHVRLQRFDATNAPVGTFETVVQSLTAPVHISSDPAGRFVVVYSDGLFAVAQRYSANGVPEGALIEASFPSLPDGGSEPDVACDEDGNFVITWTRSIALLPGGSSIEGRSYDVDGNPTSGVFAIATSVDGELFTSPSVATGPNGRFVVCYEHFETTQIRARVFSAPGVGEPEFVVATTDTRPSFSPRVAVFKDGSFAFAWHRFEGFSPDNQVFWARYSADSALQGVARAGATTDQERSAEIAFGQTGNVGIVYYAEDGAMLFSVYYSGFPVGTP